jgi:hypothetical protein
MHDSMVISHQHAVPARARWVSSRPTSSPILSEVAPQRVLEDLRAGVHAEHKAVLAGPQRIGEEVHRGPGVQALHPPPDHDIKSCGNYDLDFWMI